MAIAAFAGLLAAGVLLDIVTAKTQSAVSLRHRLNRVFSTFWAYPARAVRWHHHRREQSYQAAQPGERSPLTKWAIRAHVLVLIPLGAYFGAQALEAFAADHKPIAGLYFSPDQAWYLGGATGGIFAAVAPLVAYVVVWTVVVLPYTAVSLAAGLLSRLLIKTTGGECGRDQAPFTILGVVLGLATAGVLLVL